MCNRLISCKQNQSEHCESNQESFYIDMPGFKSVIKQKV